MDPAEDATIEIERDGSILRVAVGGRVGVEDFITVIRHWVDALAERPTSGILLDFRGIEHLELSDDDVFRAVTAKRRRLPQARDFRFAIVAPSQYLRRLSDEFVQVRDLVAGDSDDVPAIRPFDDLADAEAWLAEGRSD